MIRRTTPCDLRACKFSEPLEYIDKLNLTWNKCPSGLKTAIKRRK
jgi:hypothetical protein